MYLWGEYHPNQHTLSKDIFENHLIRFFKGLTTSESSSSEKLFIWRKHSNAMNLTFEIKQFDMSKIDMDEIFNGYAVAASLKVTL